MVSRQTQSCIGKLHPLNSQGLIRETRFILLVSRTLSMTVESEETARARFYYFYFYFILLFEQRIVYV